MSTICARIGMHCSKFSADLSSNNITDITLIKICKGRNIDKAFYFFLSVYSPLYTVHRNQLLTFNKYGICTVTNIECHFYWRRTLIHLRQH